MSDLPPTDRPLTAGDVPLLREGDVLKVTGSDSYLRDEGFSDGSLVHFRAWDGQFIDIADLPYRQGSNPGRFTFVTRPSRDERICRICDGGPGNEGVCLCGARAYENARPATSAASDAEPMRLVPDRVLADALYWMARGYERVHSMPRVSDTELASKIEGAKAALGRARDAAALASPPVSERERELEGALREARDVLRTTRKLVSEASESGFTDHDAIRALFVNNGSITRALTAQPAGEGK